MYRKYFVLVFLSYLPIIQAEKYTNCTHIVQENPKVRIFSTLKKYQANKLSFNILEENFQGNYVGFNFTSIDRIEKNAFIAYSSENVISVDLSNKSIKAIDKHAFFLLLCLQHLDISNNQISNLTDDMLIGLENLKTLNLSGNSLTYLYDSVFINLESIQILDISHNHLSDLHRSAFSNISTLQKLILSYNRIKFVRYPYFTQLLDLKELYLDHNEIAFVPTLIFRKNVHLQTLDMSGNGLVLIDMVNDTTKLLSVRNLNLSDNYIIQLNVTDILHHFPNQDLTIDFNNNQFYCSSWKEYLEKFNEKHIKIAPGRDFSMENYIDGIRCDTLNSSNNGSDSEDVDLTLNKELEDAKQYQLNNTFNNIVQELQHKKGELSLKRAGAIPDKSPLVQHGNSTAPSGINESTDKSNQGAMNGVTITLAVIGIGFLVLATFDYVLGIGLMIRLGRRLRYLLSLSSADDNEYLTLTTPS